MLYHVVYDDGDEEDLYIEEITELMVDVVRMHVRAAHAHCESEEANI